MFEYRPASQDDLRLRWEKNIADNPGDSRWPIWRDRAIAENLAGSISFLYKPVKFLEISAEYGISMLTMDRRSPGDNQKGILGLWPGCNMSSATYHALKAQLNYVGENNRFGIGYERIDPGYRTLGAYYFTNDLENITVNAYQSLWNNKLSISLSVGYEHDDLEKSKASASSRVVGSANITAAFSERVNANLSYTNFQTYTNVRSNFELINQENNLDRLDTLNFVQLSQSANLNLNIITKQDEIELLELFFCYYKKMGKDIILFTDENTHRSVKHITSTIEILKVDNEEFAFANIKLASHKNASLGMCHLDFDVVITKNEIFDMIDALNVDILTQSPSHICGQESFNCGVVRFNSQEAKKDYLTLCERRAASVAKNPRYMCLVEERSMGLLSGTHVIGTLFNNCAIDKAYVQDGYYHFLGARKNQAKQFIRRLI